MRALTTSTSVVAIALVCASAVGRAQDAALAVKAEEPCQPIDFESLPGGTPREGVVISDQPAEGGSRPVSE